MSIKCKAMKRTLIILIAMMLMLAASQNANAAWHGYYGYRGYYRPYVAPIPAPYCRPYYRPVPPPAPVFRDVWVRPHYRHTPYGDEFIPGHWRRVRVY